MSTLLHELLLHQAALAPRAVALRHEGRTITYAALAQAVSQIAAGLMDLGLAKRQRVAVFLPKQVEAVAAMFGAAYAGGVFVPINPALRPEQVVHILRDCAVGILVTSHHRAKGLLPALAACPAIRTIVVVGEPVNQPSSAGYQIVSWRLLERAQARACHRVIDRDVAAILYTSGSTGKPKGVVLSHLNLVAGARSVASYLEHQRGDRLLAALPLSFDAGFSQLTTAFLCGASVTLLDHLVPGDVIQAIQHDKITGLLAVPPLWTQLSGLPWPDVAHLRYIASTGGPMPSATLAALRAALPGPRVFLMYGLTEAFRSTYLPPEDIDRRPGSIGKAMPNVEVLVLRQDGTQCDIDEPGELVHRGALVAMGYWNDPEATAERFRALHTEAGLVLEERAVWSGDTVRMDADGYLYFVGRKDEQIKTSGYRVSPTEVEEVVMGSLLVTEAVAIGVPHQQLGQSIVVVASPRQQDARPTEEVLAVCRQRLPQFMLPRAIEWRASLPRNPNGKIDRVALRVELMAALERAAGA